MQSSVYMYMHVHVHVHVHAQAIISTNFELPVKGLGMERTFLWLTIYSKLKKVVPLVHIHVCTWDASQVAHFIQSYKYQKQSTYTRSY